jgi:hypothetical protein
MWKSMLKLAIRLYLLLFTLLQQLRIDHSDIQGDLQSEGEYFINLARFSPGGIQAPQRLVVGLKERILGYQRNKHDLNRASTKTFVVIPQGRKRLIRCSDNRHTTLSISKEATTVQGAVGNNSCYLRGQHQSTCIGSTETGPPGSWQLSRGKQEQSNDQEVFGGS